MADRKVSSFAKIILSLLLTATLFSFSCKKTEPQGQTQEKQQQTEKTKNETVQEKTGNTDMVPLEIELPNPTFIGTPANISGVDNLEKPREEGEDRPKFYVPAGITNVARGKPIMASDEQPIYGSLDLITDGDKEAVDGSFVELAPFTQHVTIDLQQQYEIYAVVVWHYHKQPTVYFDVIVQLANDPDFIIDVKTIFNNDTDNSSEMGVGDNKHYIETAEGKLLDARGHRARYVRLYSNGNNANELNHYTEVEVYGKAAK